MQIFSYLDLKSLRTCLSVCKRFNSICKDGSFYRELNFKVSLGLFKIVYVHIIIYCLSFAALLVYVFL